MDKLLKICFIIFGFLPILPKPLKGLPVILLFLIAIYYGIKSNFKDFKLITLLIGSSLFLVNIFSLINTFSFPKNKIETILSLLVVPLSFSLLNKQIKSSHERSFIIVFSITSILLSTIHFYFYYSLGLFNDTSLKVNSFRTAVVEIPLVHDHPIYVSMYLAVTILFMPWFYKNITSKVKYVFILGSFLCVIDLFLLTSKGVIISIFCCWMVLTFKNFQIKKFSNKIIILGLFLVLFFVSISHIPTLERRFRELKIKTTYTKINPNNSSSIRIGIYDCVIKTIIKKPILGYGLGVTPQRKCYEKVSKHLNIINYNSHNQYLGYLLVAGIIGFLVLFGFLLFHFKNSIYRKNDLYFIIVFFFSLIMFAENILERQSGIILFIFLMNLFEYSPITYKKVST
jgi:O-antigen ligase